MKEKKPICEYLAPRVKVMELKSRAVLCVSEGEAARNDTEMENQDW